MPHFSVYVLACALLCGACLGQEHERKAQVTGSAALCMEGGGFRAQSSDAGLIAGLLAALGRHQNVSTPTLANTGLLKRFDVLSTVSGSSWFMSSLVYSDRYHELVERMAASPGTAAKQYMTHWTTPWLKATNVDPTKFNLLRDIAMDIVTKILGKGDEDTLYTLQFFLATKFTWGDFTSTLLNSTASIGADVLLGSDVTPWAKDKYWFADHTVLMPTGDKKARLFQGKVFYPEASYVAKSSESIPLMIPAKFSIKLGAGVDSSAPFPYVASTAVPSLEDLDFEATIIPIIDKKSATTGPLDKRDFCGGVLTESAGSLPVANVASASSAFAGVAPVEGIFADEGLALADADVTPWASNAQGGKSFSVAESLVQGLKRDGGVNQKSVSALAAAAVHGVIDGGYSDGTGIAHAVASGADELLVVLNSNATNDPLYVEMLFKDGPAPVDPGTSSVLFPVFESPVALDVVAGFKAFHELILPSDTLYLKKFAVGTIKATTADNKYFGIAKGRQITINIVNLCADLGIGYGVNFDNYDMLAQEVTKAAISDQNAAFVEGTFLPMLLGKPATSGKSERGQEARIVI